MKIETKEIYKCDHCNKLYQIKNRCLWHEKICTKNPDNERACFGCKHLNKKSATIDDDYRPDFKVDLLYCAKIDSFLYPPKVEFKENFYKTYPKENNPMPRTCKSHKSD